MYKCVHVHVCAMKDTVHFIVISWEVICLSRLMAKFTKKMVVNGTHTHIPGFHLGFSSRGANATIGVLRGGQGL